MSRLRAAWLLSGLSLAGCGVLQPEAPVVQAPVPAPAVREIRSETEAAMALAYYAQMRSLSAAELARELESARRELARVRSDAHRVRYALLLTLPGSGAGEEARALEVLEPVTRSADSDLRGLALLMTAFLQEQRKLESSAQGLQQKLDALLTLERRMTGREGNGARRK